MILVGENIHIISKTVRDGLEKRDEVFVKNLIDVQKNMDYIDLNVGPARNELENILPWLCGVVENYSDMKISFDTTNSVEMENGLKSSRNPKNSLINSTSKDLPRLERMTDLAAEYGCGIVALTLSKETGIPKTADGRLEIAFEIYEKCLEKGIESSDIFFDPLILPVSVDQSQAMESLNTIKMIKESFDPPVKTIIGLSNISNGSPIELRPLINRVYAVLAHGAGLDGIIMDAKDEELFRVMRMLDNKQPESSVDNLYLKLAKMIEEFSNLEEIEYDVNESEQVKIIKTVQMLTGEKIYSHSFTQV